MTIQELIRKYRIEDGRVYGKPGSLYVPNAKKLKPAEIEEIRKNKDEILAEFARQDEEKARRKAEAERARQEQIARIKSGEEAITVCYHDGEYLSGYQVGGPAADLLAEIGLARWVHGWGYLIPDEAIKALGETFTYPQAVEYTRPAREAEAAKKAAAEAERKAKFDEARRTGKPVALRSWSENCNDPNESCDVDIVTEYAMPDGTTRTERVHTW
ncbi:MAG TPA: hypothetical protein GXX51_12340 [Firmicutes bacterium]|nr:hypothetical protein [Bacillota bacterium]